MSVVGYVMLARLFCVVRCVAPVAFRNMRVMGGLFMVTGLMVFSGGLVMFSSVFMVLRCLAVVLRGVLGHLKSP